MLSSGGHIQVMVSPPASDRAESRAGDRLTDDPQGEVEVWLGETDLRRGSWWPDYGAWLSDRSDELKAAAKTLGSRRHKATAKAPGTYVHAS